jgi:hypothetical protein
VYEENDFLSLEPTNLKKVKKADSIQARLKIKKHAIVHSNQYTTVKHMVLGHIISAVLSFLQT